MTTDPTDLEIAALRERLSRLNQASQRINQGLDCKTPRTGLLKQSGFKPISVGCWATMPGQSNIAEGADD